ncbi:NAD(+) synthase [Nitrosophilus labii]|uniref:NAD(+) synthase n=1 Tax=Nitrosophilus labii TaxID=2706014 RepID=UPI001656B791|nr:NAD(+) synthase [Nitrosophilus labii]
MYGFLRVAAASPKVWVGSVEKNVKEIVRLVFEAEKKSISILVFPELSLTSYSASDLFFQKVINSEVQKGLRYILEKTKELNIIFIIGAPVLFKSRMYNSAFVCQKGEVLGVVPKKYLPTYREFYERRWFVSGKDIKNESLKVLDKVVPFGLDILFETEETIFGVEICEDLWAVTPPSLYQSIAGAQIIFNLSASNEYVGKYEYRRELVKTQSARCIAAYVYASSGVYESTTDLVYGGHLIIAENGTVLSENERFQRENQIVYADIDVEKLKYTRVSETSFKDEDIEEFRFVKTYDTNKLTDIKRFIDPHPFVPSNPALRDSRCEEIFNIQTAGLAKRVEHIGNPKLIIGISGGLDSTLALLVCVKTMELLEMDTKNVIAITMPGFGTTSRTYKNAKALCRYLGVDFREIDIKDAVLEHFKEIGHDPKLHDVTYENAQARERTQILMDIANKEGGIVVGTGDLSEIALGFSTYNADHISMYNVNASVPKTLVRYVIEWVASKMDDKVANILKDISSTPVSPELLPSKNEKIEQKTEEIIGPYELHDFFLYHFFKYGAEPKKIGYLAKIAFGQKYEEETIKRWLKVFIKRFFANQFKRSCMPDGPKVGTISLSPRGDWRMPSDAVAEDWIKELD